jgi:hypothetical protein
MEANIIMGFAKFMSSGLGRGLRIVAGLALIVVGALFANGALGIILIVVGIIPLVAGLLDMCFIGALFLGTPLKGDDVRADLSE